MFVFLPAIEFTVVEIVSVSRVQYTEEGISDCFKTALIMRTIDRGGKSLSNLDRYPDTRYHPVRGIHRSVFLAIRPLHLPRRRTDASQSRRALRDSSWTNRDSQCYRSRGRRPVLR